jgi:hypothetical protein
MYYYIPIDTIHTRRLSFWVVYLMLIIIYKRAVGICLLLYIQQVITVLFYTVCIETEHISLIF